MRAFTIVELMVTIAIITLLTGIVVTSLAGSKSKARDAKRISDIGNIQLALELYYDRCKVYPASLSVSANNGLNGNACSVSLGDFISVIPTPPLSVPPSYIYQYKHNYDTLNVVDYVVGINLESDNEVRKDALTARPPASDPYEWVPDTALNCGVIPPYYFYCRGPN